MAQSPVTKQIFIEAPATVVYEVLTDPDQLKHWLGIAGNADAGGDNPLRPGLRGCVCIQRNYLESDTNRRVVFTWAWRRNGQEAIVIRSKVEIDLESEGEGTWVRLTHRELPKRPRRTRRPNPRREL